MEIARHLAPKLRPKYFVRTEKNYILSAPDVDAPLHMAIEMPEEIPQITVEIHGVAERSLVTAIEVLSITDKKADGRQEYLAKRRRLLRSPAHLMEIDLLRRGERVPMAETLPAAPYFVILSRADKRPVADVWPISLRLPLPVVPIPLLPGDDDVALDLQAVLASMYDAFGYDLDLDYTRPPEVPLTGDDAVWAAQRLNASGQFGA